jgi:hypothetical protein
VRPVPRWAAGGPAGDRVRRQGRPHQSQRTYLLPRVTTRRARVTNADEPANAPAGSRRLGLTPAGDSKCRRSSGARDVDEPSRGLRRV